MPWFRTTSSSVDTIEKARETVEKLKIICPVGYRLSAEGISRITGAYFDKDKEFLHPTNFLIRPDNTLAKPPGTLHDCWQNLPLLVTSLHDFATTCNGASSLNEDTHSFLWPCSVDALLSNWCAQDPSARNLRTYALLIYRALKWCHILSKDKKL